MKKEVRKWKKEYKNIVFNWIFALATLLFTILFYKNIILASISIGIISILGLIKWNSKITLLVFIFGALFGAGGEMIAISFGAWWYSNPNAYNIPLWLFFVWGNAAAFIYQSAVEIRKLGVRK